MAEDTLFGLDVVRDFILSKGGRTNNHELVTHFQSFLNSTRWKNENRQKFKEIINTLAVVKLDENGEKVLVLKKKYRTGPLPDQQEQAFSSLTKELPKHRPKAKKAKLAQQFETSGFSESPFDQASLPLARSEGDRSSLKKKAAQIEEQQAEEPQADDESQVSSTESGEASSEYGAGKGVGDEASLLMVEEITEPEEPPAAEAQATQASDVVASVELPSDAAAPSLTPTPQAESAVQPSAEVPPVVMPVPVTNEVLPASHPDPVDAAAPAQEEAPLLLEEPVTDEDIGIRSVSTSDVQEAHDDATSITSSGTDSMMSASSKEKSHSVSVRARAQQLDQVESLSPKPPIQVTSPKTQPAKEPGAEKEDSIPDSCTPETLTDAERKWMVDASRCDYQELAKALKSLPKLATYKDFILGYTALHWAARLGNTDIIKLLGGAGANVNARSHGGYTPLHLATMQGHDAAVQLLAEVYKASADIRDYSGRKPRHYLKSSANTKIQQLLQPRRVHTSSDSAPMVFRRKGSYSSRIRSLGELPFGIQGGVAMRNSWAASYGTRPRSVTPSPDPSPRQSPTSRRRAKSDKNQEIMPPPLGIPVRRVKTKRATSRENLSDSELPSETSHPLRTSSDTNIVIQTETGV